MLKTRAFQSVLRCVLLCPCVLWCVLMCSAVNVPARFNECRDFFYFPRTVPRVSAPLGVSSAGSSPQNILAGSTGGSLPAASFPLGFFWVRARSLSRGLGVDLLPPFAKKSRVYKTLLPPFSFSPAGYFYQ